MHKFVSYIRVSTQKQGDSGLGLEAQRTAIANHIDGKGQLIKEFEEIESGKKGFDGRPQLQLAIDYCKKNKCALVIGKLDRLARDVRFFLEVIDTSKIKICFADLPEVNPNTAEGRMILTSMATFAEFEARKISERTKAALAVVKNRGVQLGVKGSENIAAMNQTRADQAIAFAESLRPIMTALISTIDDKGKSMSLRKMAAALDSANVKTANGGDWTAVQVTSILKRLNLK